MNSLPDLFNGDYQACLFDMDGVLVDTTPLHQQAWQTTFDEFLKSRSAAAKQPFVAFDPEADYLTYVDGKLVNTGIIDFLASRSITLPLGHSTDNANSQTVSGLANRKHELITKLIESRGIDVYPGSVKLLESLKMQNIKTALVSSSTMAETVIEKAGIAGLLDVRIDGKFADQHCIAGKPRPDMFHAAARELNADSSQTVVFEDALSGVAAGQAGNFAAVIGVDRSNQRQALLSNGADYVVEDLAELL